MIQRSSTKSIGKWISVLYRKFQMDINKVLKPYNLNSSQYIFLIELYHKDHVSQEYLAEKLHIDKSAAARAIKQLENNGYVIRSVNPDDKRAYCVGLTEKAISIQTELRALLKAWNQKLTKNLSDQDYEFVLLSLRQMAEDILEEEEINESGR